MASSDLRGHDPYDALLSPVFSLPILRSNRLLRLGSQQLVLRSPVNLRSLLGVPDQLNPVTIGLYLHGISDLAAAGVIDAEEARDESRLWTAQLADLVSPGISGPAWGYPFPWEGRRHRMPPNTPTVVATSMVVNGLHRAWAVLGDETAQSLVAESAAFVLNDLPRAAGDDRAFCWAYSPVDRQVVLNATLKGTRILAQAVNAGRSDEGGELLSAAEASARFVVEHQDEEGGWPYAAEGDPRTWRDHYHTGYILECLHAYGELTGDQQFRDSRDLGWQNYRSRFFEGSLPLYYDDRPGPIDATAAGQALITLTLFGDVEFGEKVAASSIESLSSGNGQFAFQRRGRRVTRIHFLRWSTAWMFAGLSALTLAMSN